MSVPASVSGTSKTSGSVPPASWEANVVASHLYSCGWTSMFGFAFSKAATRALKVSKAAFSDPGSRLTTLSFSFPESPPLPPDELQAVSEASAITLASAIAFDVRPGLIVTPSSGRIGLRGAVRASGPQPHGGVTGQPAVDQVVARQQHGAVLGQGDRLGTEVHQADDVRPA